MKETIHVKKSDLKSPRRSWIRKPQTQVLPKKKRLARHKEKELVLREVLTELVE
jgi:hypothetical protein